MLSVQMFTACQRHTFTACQTLLQLIVVTNVLTGCSTTDSKTEAGVLVGIVVEVHNVAAAPGIRGGGVMAKTPTQEEFMEFLLGRLSFPREDLPAEPDHQLYIVESLQGKKLYVRSTQVFTIRTCVEIRPQPLHRDKNSWLLGEATVNSSARC